MSLLHTQAMSWHNQDGEHHPEVHRVENVGFAGHVDYHPDTLEEQHEEGQREEPPDHMKDPWDHYDEDLHDEVRERHSTPEIEAHYDEHGEYPPKHEEKVDNAYQDAFHQKLRDDAPTHHDDDLMDFTSHHGHNNELWQHKKIDLKQPIFATQSHVSQTHLDKHHANPGGGEVYDKDPTTPNGTPHRYLGNEAPMFVTHEGRMHVTEGHHRVAAALQRGDSHIHGWHFDGDEHGLPGDPDQEEDDDEDWDD